MRRIGAIAVTALALVAGIPGAATANWSDPTLWKATVAPTGRGIALSAVSAPTRHSAWAVGTRPDVEHPRQPGEAIVERWDGRRWHAAAAPKGATELDSVSARSAHDVWAAGFIDAISGPTKVWHRNRHGWHAVPSKGLPRTITASILTAGRHVWLLGGVDPGRNDAGAVIATYHPSSKSWTVLRAGPTGAFYGGAALGPDSAWAVGSTSPYQAAGHPLIARWDGHHWTTQSLPTVDGQLGSIAAHSDVDAMAVGLKTIQGGYAGVAVHFDGARWTETKFPDVYIDLPRAVAAGPSGEYWASNMGGPDRRAAYLRYQDGHWERDRGATGSTTKPDGTTRSTPQAYGLARVPHSTRTLAVGWATLYIERGPAEPTALHESTLH